MPGQQQSKPLTCGNSNSDPAVGREGSTRPLSGAASASRVNSMELWQGNGWSETYCHSGGMDLVRYPDSLYDTNLLIINIDDYLNAAQFDSS